MKVKVIQTGIKQNNSMVPTIISSLKEIDLKMSELKSMFPHPLI